MRSFWTWSSVNDGTSFLKPSTAFSLTTVSSQPNNKRNKGNTEVICFKSRYALKWGNSSLIARRTSSSSMWIIFWIYGINSEIILSGGDTARIIGNLWIALTFIWI